MKVIPKIWILIGMSIVTGGSPSTGRPVERHDLPTARIAQTCPSAEELTQGLQIHPRGTKIPQGTRLLQLEWDFTLKKNRYLAKVLWEKAHPEGFTFLLLQVISTIDAAGSAELDHTFVSRKTGLSQEGALALLSTEVQVLQGSAHPHLSHDPSSQSALDDLSIRVILTPHLVNSLQELSALDPVPEIAEFSDSQLVRYLGNGLACEFPSKTVGQNRHSSHRSNDNL